MNPQIAVAAAAITAALVFYSFGVFGERRQGKLEKHHVVLFWLGFAFDTTGTTLMTSMAQASGGSTLGLHAVSGTLAIALMLFHAVWATVVIVRGSEKARATFHRFSIIVWLFWLIPYVCGMLLGVPMLKMDSISAGTIAIIVALGMAWTMHVQAHRKHKG